MRQFVQIKGIVQAISAYVVQVVLRRPVLLTGLSAFLDGCAEFAVCADVALGTASGKTTGTVEFVEYFSGLLLMRFFTLSGAFL